jgi:2-methylcitrate dehydratase PrpD
MTEMLRLIQENRITADQVEHVKVGTNRNVPNALIYHQPKTSLEGKFCMEFCMSVLLLYGKGGLTEFTDEVVNRPAVKEMIKKIEFGIDPVAEAAGYNKMTTIVTVKLKDGRTVSGRADFAKGSPQIPISLDEVAAKFMDCAAFAKWPAAKAKAAVDLARRLEDLPDVRGIMAQLS